MNPRDEALVTAINALSTLSNHRSKWVKEVVTKTLQRVDVLVDTVPLFNEYKEEFERRINAKH